MLRSSHEIDHVIAEKFGPAGGDAGGEVVIAGSPAHLIAHPEASHTARFLREHHHGTGVVGSR